MTTHTKEDVVQRGLTKVPANQQPFLLQRANATQEVVQIDLLLVDRKGGDGSARFHQLQILAYVHLHKLRNVENRRIQVHRQHQTATVLVLQMDLAADALNALVRQDGDVISRIVIWLFIVFTVFQIDMRDSRSRPVYSSSHRFNTTVGSSRKSRSGRLISAIPRVKRRF